MDRGASLRAVGLLTVLLLASGAAPQALACSLPSAPTSGSAYVFHGEVIAAVERSWRAQPAWGWRIRPRTTFRLAEHSDSGHFDLIPIRLRPSCARRSIPVREGLADDLVPGSQVLVVAGPLPDVAASEYPALNGTVERLPDHCDLAALRDYRHRYRSDPGGLQPTAGGCVMPVFELHRDLARLEQADAEESIEILERLATVPLRITYLDLLAAHVADTDVRRRLARARYGAIMDEGCDRQAAGPVGDPSRWLQSMLRGEYCTQADPFAAEPSDPWNLFAAIREGDHDQVAAFLDAGGDPNRRLERTPVGATTPLGTALYAGQEGIALLLLDAGADLDATVLDTGAVAELGLAQVMDRLLTQEPARFAQTESLPARACDSGNSDLVNVVLHHAARQGRFDAALLDQVIAGCIIRGHEDLALGLLERGFAPGPMSAAFAARASSVGLLRILLATGLDVSQRVESPHTGESHLPIDVAWQRYKGNEWPDDQELDPYGSRQRMQQEREQARFMLHELLQVGPAPTGAPDLGDIPLDADAELEALASDPEARLLLAVRLGLRDRVAEFIRHGADQALLRAATIAAIHQQQPHIVRLLLEAGAGPGGGVLHAAARGSSPELVRELLARGADPNEMIDGRTPLAASHDPLQHPQAAGDWRIHEVLVAAGADY